MTFEWNALFTALKLKRPAKTTGFSTARECCSIGIFPDQFLIGISRGFQSLKSDLLLAYPFQKHQFAAALRNVVEDQQLGNMPCRWVLYPDQYLLFLMDDLPVAADEFQAAIRWKLGSMIPYPAEEALVDYFRIPPQKKHEPQPMIMVAVSHAPYLEKYAENLVYSGLNLTAISIQEIALSRITSLFCTDERSSALLYLEENAGELLIVRQKTLYLQRRFSDGWGRLDDIPSAPKETRPDCVLADLTLEIQRSIDYYQTQWRHVIPAQILFATNLPEQDSKRMADQFDACFSIPVTLLPTERIFPESYRLWREHRGSILPVLGGLLSAEGG